MKLSTSLKLRGQYWERNSYIFDLEEDRLTDAGRLHMKLVYGPGWFFVLNLPLPEDCATLCYLEAEYQKDIECESRIKTK